MRANILVVCAAFGLATLVAHAEESSPPASSDPLPQTSGQGLSNSAPPADIAAHRRETVDGEAPAAPATESRDAAVDIPAPALPDVTVTFGPPAGTAATPAVDVDIPPPDLPPVTLALPVDPVAEALKTRIAMPGALAHPRLARAVREEIEAFYAARNRDPLWVTGDGWNAAAKGALQRLARADEDGLDPTAYAVTLGKPDNATERLAALAEADLKLSVAVVMYARDARGGRIDAKRLSNLIDPTIDLPDAKTVLTTVSAAADADEALQKFNPQQPGYLALRKKLIELRDTTASTIALPHIPAGVALRVGMNDPRVPLVRARFGVASDSDATTYDENVARAVALFQRERGLPATGVLTRQTVAALTRSPNGTAEANLVANMERWRWLPASLGERYVFVNIPEYLVRIVENDVTIHQARVIVGKPEAPTPIFSHEMEYIVVNPSWYVPPSILKKEFLPALAADPDYAAKKGYQVIRRGNSISVRQPPGERNALGNIKFMFPNRHAVYLHDTPSRGLFSNERRAFSHGCVRVDQPLRFGELILGRDNGWTEARLRRLIGRGEQTVRLKQKLPIHLVYFTEFVDETGRLQHRDDLYGVNRRVKMALGLEG